MKIKTDTLQEVEIRPLDVKHLPDVLKIENKVFSVPWSINLFYEELFSERRIYLAALISNVLVGYCGMSYFEPEGHLNTLAVAPNLQGTGIGKKLLCELINKAKVVDIKEIWLEVRSKNKKAINLYTSLGFMPVSIRKHYYDKPIEDALIMCLEIKKNDH
jgi:ribosomal-protein-alanine N-acetyltransferase